MATYTHFGNQAEVFKHLVLWEILKTEKPQVYVEKNPASAIYRRSHTVEQKKGIYHFLEKANKKSFLEILFIISWKV